MSDEPVRLASGSDQPFRVLPTPPVLGIPLDQLESSPQTGDQAALDMSAADRGGIIDALHRRGVQAERISSPDLLAQLHQSLRRPVDTAICNLLDSDRELPLNQLLARHRPAELAEGIDLLARAAGASRILAAAPTGAGSAFSALAAETKRFGLRIITLPNEYPLADPTMLLYRLLNRRLRPRRLPVEQGALLFDGAAALAAGQCALRRQSMTHVPLAVHDHVRGRSFFVMAAVGTPLRWLLEHLQCVSRQQMYEIRAGALLRDRRVGDVDRAVVAASELTIHVSLPSRAVNPDPCIRCSWCVESCPTRIHPAGLLEAAQRGDGLLAERYGIEACIECGVCSYVCPSRLPILSGIRRLRDHAAAAGGLP